jgi:hypothetical protein
MKKPFQAPLAHAHGSLGASEATNILMSRDRGSACREGALYDLFQRIVSFCIAFESEKVAACTTRRDRHCVWPHSVLREFLRKVNSDWSRANG